MVFFNIFETLALVFIIESLLYVGFLITSSKSNSNTILSTFLLLHVVLLSNLYVYQHSLFKVPYFYFEFVALLAPLQYLYVTSIIKRDFKLSADQLINFIPFAIILLIRMLSLMAGFDGDSIVLTRALTILLFIHVYSYLYLSFRQIHHFHQTILLTQSDFDSQNLKWVVYELVLLGVYFFMLGLESLSLFTDIAPFYEITILVAFISLLAYINVLVYKSLRMPIVTKGITVDEVAIAGINKSKYAKSTLTQESSDRLFNQLVGLMEKEKLYRQFDLSLNKLTDLLDVPMATLSQVINENANKNFNDFVNSYRVEEAMAMLSKRNGMLIKNVMYESGFQSTSTFNTSFKKITGYSPTEFKAQSGNS